MLSDMSSGCFHVCLSSSRLEGEHGMQEDHRPWDGANAWLLHSIKRGCRWALAAIFEPFLGFPETVGGKDSHHRMMHVSGLHSMIMSQRLWSPAATSDPSFVFLEPVGENVDMHHRMVQVSRFPSMVPCSFIENINKR